MIWAEHTWKSFLEIPKLETSNLPPLLGGYDSQVMRLERNSRALFRYHLGFCVATASPVLQESRSKQADPQASLYCSSITVCSTILPAVVRDDLIVKVRTDWKERRPLRNTWLPHFSAFLRCKRRERSWAYVYL